MSIRGERNNNPLNIRKSSQWFHGEVQGNDPEFKTFDSPENGIRAGAAILHTYFVHYGLNTITKVISRWAPPNENDTDAYIEAVAQGAKFGAYQVLNFNDPKVLAAVIKPMIKVEDGEVIYTDEQITDGVGRVFHA